MTNVWWHPNLGPAYYDTPYISSLWLATKVIFSFPCIFRTKRVTNWKTWNWGVSTSFKCKLLHCTVAGDCCREKPRKFSIAPITWHTVRWNSSLLFFHLLLVFLSSLIIGITNEEVPFHWSRFGEAISQMRAIPRRSSSTANDLSLRRGQGTFGLADEPRCKGVQRLLERGILLSFAGKTHIPSEENLVETCSGIICIHLCS